MKTLLIAATSEELSGTQDYFKWPNQPFVETKDTDILISGVGMTATAFALGKHLSPKYDLILNLGIAGSFDRSVELGTVVNITEDIFAELGAQDKDSFLSIDQLGFGSSSYKATGTQNFSSLKKLRSVKGITVNTVHGNKKSIENIINRLNPQIESMEGAAVFYACTQMNIPCLQIRSISNYVEERNRGNWKIGLAMKNLNLWAIDFLTKP